MAASIFRALSNLRMVLDTETDADSPHNETTYAALREMAEMLFKLAFSTGETGTVTTIAETILTDSARTWTIDEHIGRTLLMTSGAAKGNFYTIDDNAATTLTLTGDTLVSDGVVITDDYEILFDIKTNSDGHDHDDTNSKKIVASIDQTSLKTTTVELNQLKDVASNKAVTGAGSYAFWPQVKEEGTNGDLDVSVSLNFAGATYATVCYMNYTSTIGGEYGYARFRYVQASGEAFWIFILREKATKEIFSMTAAPDHCCFGNGGKPKLTPHPFVDVYEENGKLYFDGHEKTKKEVEILVINPSEKQVTEMKRAQFVDDDDKPDRAFLQVLIEDYEINDTIEPDWPAIPVTVGLPPDWEDAYHARKSVKPVKKIIPQPDLIKTAGLKRKSTEVTK